VPATEKREWFEPDSREVSRARRFVTRALQAWGLDADIPPLELMVSELVSNALVHGTGQISVQLSCQDSSLRLEVSDEGGVTSPHLRPPTVGGWGLQFVDELADSWGSEKRGHSTLVWAVKRTSGA